MNEWLYETLTGERVVKKKKRDKSLFDEIKEKMRRKRGERDV